MPQLSSTTLITSQSLVWAVTLVALSQTSVALLPQSEVSRVARITTDFGIRVFREVAASSGERNVAFSPYGIASVLAMLQMAAAGETRRQIQESMAFGLHERGVPRALRWLRKALADPKSKDIVETADALFVQRDLDLTPGFMPRFYQAFRQMVKQVDFKESREARRVINAWVQDNTKGTIQDFLAEGTLNPMTRLILLNAIYFKGLWKQTFPEKDTRERLFHKMDGTTVSVPMMQQTAKFNYGEFSSPTGVEYDVIQLPFEGDNLSLLIAAPFNPDTPLSFLTDIINSQLLGEWKRNMKEVTRQLVVPKFSLESEVDLRRPLEMLGMKDMFDASKANFSSLSEQEPLFVAQALQKVKIDVNENGTEVSSATAFFMYARMAPLEIVMDRPFLFLVEHEPTGLIPFMGQLMEP